jgi:hypothetical protein
MRAAACGAGAPQTPTTTLSGATIVFFTPGYEGKRFIYEHAHALGVRSMIIDVCAARAARAVSSPRAAPPTAIHAPSPLIARPSRARRRQEAGRSSSWRTA